MVDNCKIVEEDLGISMEIDLFEHMKLLEDLTNFSTKNWEIENLKRKLIMVILLEMYF